MQVTPELTRKVAGLARLKLTDTEVTEFTAQLSKILGYIEALGEVDTSDPSLVPMTHSLEVETPLREDVICEFPRGADGTSKLLANAPEVLHDGYKVPPIL